MSLPENETPVCFPTTLTEFNQLIDDLMEDYALDDRDHTIAMVVNRIQHAPPDQMETTMEDFGRRILKNKSYQLAQFIGAKAQHKAQMDQLGAMLKTDPHNQEAVDHLQKAINAGSEYAKTIMDGIFPPEPCQVLTMSHIPTLDAALVKPGPG